MIITETELPFDFCEKCPEFLLDVDMKTIYADDGIMTRQLVVGCRHQWLCKQLIEKVGKENASDIKKPMQRM